MASLLAPGGRLVEARPEGRFVFCEHCHQLLYPDVIPTALVGKVTTMTMSNVTAFAASTVPAEGKPPVKPKKSASRPAAQSLVLYCKKCNMSKPIDNVNSFSIYAT
jgi:RNase P subunit RPR2